MVDFWHGKTSFVDGCEFWCGDIKWSPRRCDLIFLHFSRWLPVLVSTVDMDWKVRCYIAITRSMIWSNTWSVIAGGIAAWMLMGLVSGLPDECRRVLRPNTEIPKTPGDNGFRIKISPSSATYSPGHNYTRKRTTTSCAMTIISPDFRDIYNITNSHTANSMVRGLSVVVHKTNLAILINTSNTLNGKISILINTSMH